MISHIPLGSTDILVSRIGLGTVKFGRNQGVKYPEHFELPSDKKIISLLACAQNLGINLLDTAPAYGTSEERIGTLLGVSRKDWVISTKAGEEFVEGKSFFDFTPKAIKKSVHQSLKRLHTDYIDIVLIHSDGNDEKNIKEFDVFNTLEELKKAGVIRAFGMSTKTIEGGLLTIEHADVAMITYNMIDTKEKEIITAAHKANKGIFIKKAFASGHLEKLNASNPIETSLKFILEEPGVSSVIVGTLNEEHLKHNVRCVSTP